MIKNLCKFLPILLTLLGAACSPPQPRTYDPNHRYSVDQIQEDLQQLRKIVKQHPAMARASISNKLDQVFTELFKEASEPMTLIEFYCLAGRMTDPLSCGHTFLSLPESFQEYARNHLKQFPAKLFFQSGRAYLLKDFSIDSSIPAGSEILSVNGESMMAIIGRMRSVITSDGPSGYEYAKLNRMRYGLFPGYPEFPGQYSVTYIPPGGTPAVTVNIEARFHAGIMDTKRRSQSESVSYHPYQFELIDSLSTAVVTVRDFIGFPKGDFERFLEASFTTVQENDINNLIVDLRGNDGGDPAYAAAVLSYLASREIVYFTRSVYGYKSLKRPVRLNPLGFRGKLYVLMDGGCFSTTGHLLSLLRFHKFGILVGEESGGSFRCYGCPKSYTLSHTGINLDCQRCVFATEVAGFEIGRGIRPDIEVRPAIEDLTRGRDTAKRFIFDLIQADDHSS